ncbi:MAG: FdtA/QdtA family cupin domain-containing protein [Thermoplasmatales archaeon]
MKKMECKLINFKKISDPRGNLTVIESLKDIPFEIKRIYYIYDVPGGESRGGHAHRTLEQLIIAVSGSFDVKVDDGIKKKTFSLNRAYYGLLVPKMIWREMNNFSSGSVCLVLASDFYRENDYIRVYDEFLGAVNEVK